PNTYPPLVVRGAVGMGGRAIPPPRPGARLDGACRARSPTTRLPICASEHIAVSGARFLYKARIYDLWYAGELPARGNSLLSLETAWRDSIIERQIVLVPTLTARGGAAL